MEFLVHFDTKKPLVFSLQYISIWVGRCVVTILRMGRRDPPERNNVQSRKYGLRVIFGVEKFHQHVFGRSFKIISGHKLQLGLLHEHEGISSMGASRIQR